MGGELGGVLGVYLSIPIAATVRIVWVSWRKYSSAIAAMTPPASGGRIPNPSFGGKLRELRGVSREAAALASSDPWQP